MDNQTDQTPTPKPEKGNYTSPAITAELDLETRAGSPLSIPEFFPWEQPF